MLAKLLVRHTHQSLFNPNPSIMTFVTRILFLCLLSVSFFSCIEEVDTTIRPSTEPGWTLEPEDPATTEVGQFRIGSNTVELAHAYIHTSPAPEGENFQHHIVLSSEDVLVDGDLRSSREIPTIALLLESSSSSPIGNFTVAAGSLLDANGSRAYAVSRGNFLLRGLEFDSGSSVTITANGDEFVIKADIRHNTVSYYTFNGVYEGSVLPIASGGAGGNEAEAIDPDLFTGENFMTHNDQPFDLTDAYVAFDGDSYRLYLSDRPVFVANELTGTSNVMLLFLSAASNGDVAPGRHTISDDSFGNEGYFFAATNSSAIRSSYFCRNMNFDTNRADDDEPMDTGETLVRIEDDNVSIKFNFTSARGAEVQGEYHGEIVKAD